MSFSSNQPPQEEGAVLFSTLFGSAEDVGPGHPDRFMDTVADACVDAALLQDPNSRLAIEGLCGGESLNVVLKGEITTNAEIGWVKIVNDVASRTGYKTPFEVIVDFARQSPDIAQGVNTGGAGDQGGMWGFYTRASRSGLHPAMHYARQLTLRLLDPEVKKLCPWIGPDTKSQIVIEEGRVVDVVLAVMHDKEITTKDLRREILQHVVHPVLGYIPGRVTINGTGLFVIGGPEGDTGTVGRKIVVQQGGYAQPVGGGAFSGKDPTKVDRSAAYMAHFVAKSLVHNGLLDNGDEAALVHVCYAIGVAEPRLVGVYTRSSPHEPRPILSRIARERFDWRPEAIIERFDLRHPHLNGWSYEESARLGPFGRNLFPWEKVESL